MPKAKAKPAVKPGQRWDVVIYEMATLKVVSVVGTDLPETGSFHTVDKRIETAMGRINLDAYSVAKVPPGKYGLHAILRQGDINP